MTHTLAEHREVAKAYREEFAKPSSHETPAYIDINKCQPFINAALADHDEMVELLEAFRAWGEKFIAAIPCGPCQDDGVAELSVLLARLAKVEK